MRSLLLAAIALIALTGTSKAITFRSLEPPYSVTGFFGFSPGQEPTSIRHEFFSDADMLGFATRRYYFDETVPVGTSITRSLLGADLAYFSQLLTDGDWDYIELFNTVDGNGAGYANDEQSIFGLWPKIDLAGYVIESISYGFSSWWGTWVDPDSHQEWATLWVDQHLTVHARGVDDPHPVPEPATLALLGMGVLGVGAVRRRRNT
jgi:hypothetical protein